MIVDASALLAIALAEPDADAMLAALGTAAQIRIPAPNWLEATMVIDRRGDPEAARLFEAVMQEMRIEVLPWNAAHAAEARLAWDRFGKGRHRAQLNFGDCMAYSAARVENQPLLFKGDDFTRTDIEPALKV
jgi:ribonuclease VapC